MVRSGLVLKWRRQQQSNLTHSHRHIKNHTATTADCWLVLKTNVSRDRCGEISKFGSNCGFICITVLFISFYTLLTMDFKKKVRFGLLCDLLPASAEMMTTINSHFDRSSRIFIYFVYFFHLFPVEKDIVLLLFLIIFRLKWSFFHINCSVWKSALIILELSMKFATWR